MTAQILSPNTHRITVEEVNDAIKVIDPNLPRGERRFLAIKTELIARFNSNVFLPEALTVLERWSGDSGRGSC